MMVGDCDASIPGADSDVYRNPGLAAIQLRRAGGGSRRLTGAVAAQDAGTNSARIGASEGAPIRDGYHRAELP